MGIYSKYTKPINESAILEQELLSYKFDMYDYIHQETVNLRNILESCTDPEERTVLENQMVLMEALDVKAFIKNLIVTIKETFQKILAKIKQLATKFANKENIEFWKNIDKQPYNGFLRYTIFFDYFESRFKMVQYQDPKIKPIKKFRSGELYNNNEIGLYLSLRDECKFPIPDYNKIYSIALKKYDIDNPIDTKSELEKFIDEYGDDEEFEKSIKEKITIVYKNNMTEDAFTSLNKSNIDNLCKNKDLIIYCLEGKGLLSFKNMIIKIEAELERFLNKIAGSKDLEEKEVIVKAKGYIEGVVKATINYAGNIGNDYFDEFTILTRMTLYLRNKMSVAQKKVNNIEKDRDKFNKKHDINSWED
jgi:hypothetical protein